MTYYKITNSKGRSWSPPAGFALRYRMDRRTKARPGTGVLVFATLERALEHVGNCRGVKIYEGRGGPRVTLPPFRLETGKGYTAQERRDHWAGKEVEASFRYGWPQGTQAVEWFSPRKLVHRG